MLPNADGLVATHTWMATHTRKAAHTTLLGAPNTVFAQGREPPLPKCVLSHRRAGVAMRESCIPEVDEVFKNKMQDGSVPLLATSKSYLASLPGRRCRW